MMKNSSALKRYYRQIRSWLPVSSRQKHKIVGDLSSSIDAFLDAHPEAELGDIQSHFGTPAGIAAAYVDNADTTELLRKLRIRKRVIASVVASILVAVLLVTGTLAWELYGFHKNTNGSITEAVTDNGAAEIIP